MTRSTQPSDQSSDQLSNPPSNQPSNQQSNQQSDQPSNQPRNTDSSANDRAEQERESIPDDERTLGGRPADPNRTGAGKQFPPGVKPEEVWDPGNATPDAPPVDNDSGRRD